MKKPIFSYNLVQFPGLFPLKLGKARGTRLFSLSEYFLLHRSLSAEEKIEAKNNHFEKNSSGLGESKAI